MMIRPSKRLLALSLALAFGFGVWTIAAVDFADVATDFEEGDTLSASEFNTLFGGIQENFEQAAVALAEQADELSGLESALAQKLDEDQPDSISTEMLQDGAVTLAKIDTDGAAEGDSAVFDGDELVWNGPAPGWSLTGNAGTDPEENFVGTTNEAALEFRVNDQRALRFEPTAESPNLIGGFVGNEVSAGVEGATIGGGGESQFDRSNEVTGDFGTVGGGRGNTAGPDATVAGGQSNVAIESWAVVAGGTLNEATDSQAAVVGGQGNIASGHRSFIGGGVSNQASGSESVLGGGFQNEAVGSRAVVAGGSGNRTLALGAAIGGGTGNTASHGRATVAGGRNNSAHGPAATVAGGEENSAFGEHAAVGGGFENAAPGQAATVPGGLSNEAEADHSFAAGTRSKVDSAHDGAFLWADSTDEDFASEAADEFAVRAGGGVRFVVGNTTCTVFSGDNDWDCSVVSDQRAKRDVRPVDAREILERLAQLPISEWSYKGGDAAVRHVGPMAQDFHDSFDLGGSATRISGQDVDGVTLAAIQALYELVNEQQETIASQENRIDELERQQDRLAALEQENAELRAKLRELGEAVQALKR